MSKIDYHSKYLPEKEQGELSGSALLKSARLADMNHYAIVQENDLLISPRLSLRSPPVCEKDLFKASVLLEREINPDGEALSTLRTAKAI
jgi:hypothetical protein